MGESGGGVKCGKEFIWSEIMEKVKVNLSMRKGDFWCGKMWNLSVWVREIDLRCGYLWNLF